MKKKLDHKKMKNMGSCSDLSYETLYRLYQSLLFPFIIFRNKTSLQTIKTSINSYLNIFIEVFIVECDFL